MSKQIVALVVGVVVLVVVVGYSAQARDHCQKPNPNTKACFEPTDSVGEFYTWYCGMRPRSQCSGAIYEINQFPDGAVTSGTGLTMTQSAPCYRSRNCSWVYLGWYCGVANWSSWTHRQKTVTNPNGICPDE
jgi:hypothetical protein